MGLLDLCIHQEIPFQNFLDFLQIQGIYCDNKGLIKLNKNITRNIEKLSSLIDEQTDGQTDITISAQLKDLLFTKLNLPYKKKFETSDTTDTPSYRDWETDRKSTRLNSSH